MRLALAALLVALTLGGPAASRTVAGDEPTLQGKPGTPDETAAKFLSTDGSERATGDRVIAAASSDFLRQVLAAIRERLAKPAPPPLVIEPLKGGVTPAEPPGLPEPSSRPGKTQGISIMVRMLDVPREAARTMLGCEAGGAKPAVRLPPAEEVTRILDAVEKEEGGATRITSTRITVYDGQRSTVQVLQNVSYIADFEVERGTTTVDPIVGTVAEGIVLDVRPTVASDRKSIRMDLSTKIAHLERPIEQQEVAIPGVDKPLKLQRPELLTAGWSKTLTVPDGGYAIAGGWVSIDTDGKEHVLLILLDAKSVDVEGVEPSISPDDKTPR